MWAILGSLVNHGVAIVALDLHKCKFSAKVRKILECRIKDTVQSQQLLRIPIIRVAFEEIVVKKVADFQ